MFYNNDMGRERRLADGTVRTTDYGKIGVVGLVATVIVGGGLVIAIRSCQPNCTNIQPNEGIYNAAQRAGIDLRNGGSLNGSHFNPGQAPNLVYPSDRLCGR